MTRRSRYLLLLLGFIIFLILAPLIVLYVRGVNFNFAKGTFVTNGILAVRAQPSDVDIFLNNALKKRGSGDIKFVPPGDYEVSIKKSGYNTWSKRLTISPGQVTWANPTYSYIYLLHSTPAAQSIATGTVDFYADNGKLLVLKKDSLTAGPLYTLARQISYALPKAVNAILAHDNGGDNFVLADTSGQTLNPAIILFNSGSGSFTDLGGLFGPLPKFQFGDNGELYALSTGVLYKVGVDGKTKTPLFSGVQAFCFLNNSLYFAQIHPEGVSLVTSQAPFSDSQGLLTNLPAVEGGELVVTYEKQIFLLAGQSLYLANSSMQKLLSNVTSWDFNPKSSVLSLKNGSEIYYYDAPASSLNFVTRSGEPVMEPLIKTSIGWALMIRNNKLTAIELDTRDSQNQYALYSGKNLQKFYIDDAGQKIWLLDNGEVKSLIIR